PAFDSETLILGEVPVEDVHLHRRERVKIAFQNFNRLEVTRDVDQQTAPRETWLVLDQHAGKEVTIPICAQELQQSLEPAHCANDSGRFHYCLSIRDVDAIALVFAD